MQILSLCCDSTVVNEHGSFLAIPNEMRWNVIKNLLILMSSITLPAKSLKCFEGFEGEHLNVNSIMEHEQKEWMCVYETMKPCDFKDRPELQNFRMTKYNEEVSLDRAGFAVFWLQTCTGYLRDNEKN
ncbi:hypothetical protein Y032_0906g2972 [Ancylostoma ceylanicum]|nr:hypothetical protein Y032_0906g2972 [Ancylostoma ceylanicum]